MSNVTILSDIKKMLNIEPTDSFYDTDLLVILQSTIMGLKQLGVVNDTNLDSNSTWESLSYTKSFGDLLGVKTFMYLKTKMIFDPPANSFVMDALSNQISELEWRLNSGAEHE